MSSVTPVQRLILLLAHALVAGASTEMAAAQVASATTRPGDSPVAVGPHFRTATLPGIGTVWMELVPFEILAQGFELRVEGAAGSAGGGGAGAAPQAAPDAGTVATIDAAARAVRAFKGTIAGEPGSSAYIAESPRGRLGMISVRGRRFALAPEQGAWAGPIRGPQRWVESPGAGAPPLDRDEVCSPRAHPEVPRGGGVGCCGAGRGEGEGGLAGLAPLAAVRGMRVLVAADCDYEFTSIFESAEDAAAYIVSLYGAVDWIYDREMGVRVQLSFMRLWMTPDDPFNAPDPLNQFRNHWNENMQDVVRDVAHLQTGRRNLPYGGVAWLSSACTSFGYAVNGYLIGSFVDAGRPDPGNWDIIVTAHELGHNIGTLHTHDYGIDTCASGTVLRGGFLSYCHIVSGATANVDLTLHRILRERIAEFLVQAPCIGRDCDGDGIEDSEAIALGLVADLNGDGIPDHCQDCDGDGVLDPDAIAAGAIDLDGDGIPDHCQPDCNGNGVVDIVDILAGTSEDRWGNDIPDECEIDCNGNGISDYNEILEDMSLDIDRDGRLDACQDCDGDGTLDAEVLASSRHWWVASSGSGALRELHPRSGVRIRTSDAAPSSVRDIVLGGDGLILGTFGDSIGRWDPVSGAYLGTFGGTHSGSIALNNTQGLLVLPDDSVVVANFGTASLLRFSATGAPLGVFAQLSASSRPVRLALRCDGVVAVSASDGRVHGFQWPGGAPIGVLADLNAVGAGPDPTGLLYLPGGDLLVASRGFDSIERFDGWTGTHKGRFDVGPNPSSSIALRDPMTMRLIADDRVVLVTANASGAPIVGLDAGNGYHLRTYRVYPADAPTPTGLVVMPASPLDCNGNFIPDSCDIAAGVSEDRNGDGVPDECQGGPWAPEDLDFDGRVDGADLGVLLGFWGACPVPCPADFNGDGVVDGADLGRLLGAWTG